MTRERFYEISELSEHTIIEIDGMLARVVGKANDDNVIVIVTADRQIKRINPDTLVLYQYGPLELALEKMEELRQVNTNKDVPITP